jgi:hypothetical protein
VRGAERRSRADGRRPVPRQWFVDLPLGLVGPIKAKARHDRCEPLLWSLPPDLGSGMPPLTPGSFGAETG